MKTGAARPQGTRAEPAVFDLLLQRKVMSMNKSKTTGRGILPKPVRPKDEGGAYCIETKTISLDLSHTNPQRATKPSAKRWQGSLSKEMV